MNISGDPYEPENLNNNGEKNLVLLPFQKSVYTP